jgi:hypothetical protein
MDYAEDQTGDLSGPGTVRSFAGVRGRVKAAVAAQPSSVTLAQALAQMQKAQTLRATKRSID